MTATACEHPYAPGGPRFGFAPKVHLCVSRAVERGEDPLGVGLADDPDLKRVTALVSRAAEGVDDETASRVAAAVTSRLSSTRTIGNPGGIMPMDPLFALALAHQGIDPLVATWLSLLVGIVEYDDLSTGYRAASIDGTSPARQSSSEVLLGEARPGDVVLTHSSDDALRLCMPNGRLPETTLTLVEGMRMGEVFAHPAFEDGDVRIARVEQRDLGIHLHTDHLPRPATVDQLAAASAAMRR